MSSPNERTHFHLGEGIRLTLRYTAAIRGKYLLAGPGAKAQNWEPETIACTPDDTLVDRRADDGTVNGYRYLHEGCDGGVGGGVGGGCGDCGIEATLGPQAILKELLVNRTLQFTRPGIYTCTVTDASIVTADSAPHYRALRLRSKPFTLEITDDSAWSASALKSILDRFSAHKCSAPGDGALHCFELAEELRFLDTPDSVAAIAQLLTNDPKLASYQQQLWLGLFQSRHQDDVIRLLEMRFTDPDFPVSIANMEVLTGIRLRKAFPQAYSKTAKPDDFRTPAVFLLQETLRKIGDSLGDKLPGAKEVSAKTYETLSSESFCQSETVIPDAERKRVLKQAFVAARPSAH